MDAPDMTGKLIDEPVIRCGDQAVGYIMRPDGYSCSLCKRHWEEDWAAVTEREGYTLGRYPIAFRDQHECERRVPLCEIVRIKP